MLLGTLGVAWGSKSSFLQKEEENAGSSMVPSGPITSRIAE